MSTRHILEMTFSAAALAAAACVATVALAQQPAAPDAAQVERRLASVETLIERSSGAVQVEASGNAAAR